MNITLVLIIIICCIIICILAMKNKKNNEIIERYGNVIDKKTSVTNEQREELNKYEWLLNKNVKGNEYIQNIVKNKDGDIIIVVIQEMQNGDVNIYLKSKYEPINSASNMILTSRYKDSINICDIYGGKRQRNGNGTLLLDALKEYAKKKEIKKIYGKMVPNLNFISYEGLRAFYIKNEFVIHENSNQIEYNLDFYQK
ncbi:hypothetical protein [Lachnospira eligens]|jgi:hypothetical protein|uniref:hypothetical protein n=1 Tax=Lachnospira eligens TaxID=39485 RepID=UPI000E5D3631|nr:hypothetical protein [Lachnospira eligens]RGZ67688.1 hypothetical protein DW976_14510 [Lachnospira eligens]